MWQQGQKVMAYDLGKIEKIMSETYMLIKQVDEEVALEQAVKFCQVHMGASAQKQSTAETPTLHHSCWEQPLPLHPPPPQHLLQCLHPRSHTGTLNISGVRMQRLLPA